MHVRAAKSQFIVTQSDVRGPRWPLTYGETPNTHRCNDISYCAPGVEQLLIFHMN